MKPYDDVINAVFEAAKNLGAKQVETYLDDSSSLSFRIFKQDFESFDLRNTRGLGIRVLSEGSFGSAYTESFEQAALADTLRQAFENARLSQPNEANALPSPDNKPEVKMQLFSEELEQVPLEQKIELAKSLERFAQETDPAIFNVPWSLYSQGGGLTRVTNSNGIDRYYRANMAFAFNSTLARKGEEVKDGSEVKASRNYAEINAKEIATTAAKKALQKLGSQVPSSGSYPVVFTPRGMIALLSVFSAVFSAKNVQMGKSLLAGKLGQSICNKGITIIDDALMTDGMGTRPFDAEGITSRKLELISNGVLKNYLYNTVAARKDKVESTGHAARGGFKGSVEIAPSNLYIVPGKKSAQEIEKSEPEAIRIEDLQGLHASCNPISGDFSASASGFMLKNGEVTAPLHNFTVSGNFLKMLNNVEIVGSDLDFHYSNFGSPTLLVSGLSIAGK